MSELRGPNEDRLLDELGETGADTPQEGGGGGGTDLEESYVSPQHEESESYMPPDEEPSADSDQ